MNIVKATKNQVKDVVYLNSFVQRMHVENHPDIFKSPEVEEKNIETFFYKLLERDDCYLFVAYDNDDPVGYIWFTHDKFPNTPFKYERDQIYIHQIIVHDDHKRKSIGSLLMGKTQEIGKELNINHYLLDTWEFNSEAQNFFSKQGFSTFNRKMWLCT